MTASRIIAALVLAATSHLAVAQETPRVESSVPVPAQEIPPSLENSVVKVFATLRRPDPFRPWGKAAPAEVTGSGVVIEGRRILTNAHVVGYASQVQIQANEAGDKVSATVVAVARDMDLAVLKLDDESFFDTHAPLPRASVLPNVRDQVFAYGYPTGGTSLSITKGIVSRIEFVNYSFDTAGLRIQIDAAINSGNSGGPAIAGDKMVGLAFGAASNAQSIGYIIPNEEVELFLRDVADGRYDGKPALLADTQTLENPTLRAFLKLDKSVTGAVVQSTGVDDPAFPLKEWDVISKIGNSSVDNQSMVQLGSNLRVRFQYRVQQLAKNGKVPLTIYRDGKRMELNVPVVTGRKLLIPDLNGGYPSYFIYGPIVFSRATAEFLNFMAGNPNALNSYGWVASPLVTRRSDEPTPEREELVVVSSPFFPHKLVTGYSNRFGSVIYSINKVPVRSLAHLVTLLRDATDDTIVIHFDQRGGENMVLKREDMLAATEEVLSDNGIRLQGTKDMMDIWNRKK
ncbi:trypsin-like peptidase domain-containing protein [Massilia sp. PAMC28688]|uniref:S1C family serine protease n=1 Tax=Massilia sp. PAMC28688 TaxID=2861283 RepID=UPI001C638D78|nr:S1C family serine protease [Massilia sp. PAMC28688]QYF94878.1 trypsin-like peptidase domain-containing protein [Massilia sp. PAMC28688]